MLGDRPIFVAGMPRAGSTWTYNVARRLIRLTGKTPWPEKIPTDERTAAEDALSGKPDGNRVHCIKTHFAIPADRPDVRIVCNFRDIRDATLSFMRFMKCPFSAALESARASMEITDHYLQSGSRSVLPVDYDDVIGSPHQAVRKIAVFIEAEASNAEIDDIVADLSRECVAGRLEKLDKIAADQTGPMKSSPDSGRYTSIRNADGSFRIFDSETGFQSNHFTSGKCGEWREAFSAAEQSALHDLLASWLQRYGYKT